MQCMRHRYLAYPIRRFHSFHRRLEDLPQIPQKRPSSHGMVTISGISIYFLLATEEDWKDGSQASLSEAVLLDHI